MGPYKWHWWHCIWVTGVIFHPRNKWSYDCNPILKTGCPGFTLKGINGFPTTFLQRTAGYPFDPRADPKKKQKRPPNPRWFHASQSGRNHNNQVTGQKKPAGDFPLNPDCFIGDPYNGWIIIPTELGNLSSPIYPKQSKQLRDLVTAQW